MAAPRYLCSHLVRFSADNCEQWANLEEIQQNGAVLECDEAVRDDAVAKISAGDVSFEGRVTAVQQHEFGWRVEMAFSHLTPWTIEQWKPGHALDPAKLK
jgi:hypothetical protein